MLPPPPPSAALTQESTLLNKDLAINDLQSLFNSGIFKTTNVSQFALALAHALTQVVPPSTSKTYEINSLLTRFESLIFQANSVSTIDCIKFSI